MVFIYMSCIVINSFSNKQAQTEQKRLNKTTFKFKVCKWKNNGTVGNRKYLIDFTWLTYCYLQGFFCQIIQRCTKNYLLVCSVTSRGKLRKGVRPMEDVGWRGTAKNWRNKNKAERNKTGFIQFIWIKTHLFIILNNRN